MKKYISGVIVTILFLTMSAPTLAEDRHTSELQATIEQLIQQYSDTTAAVSLSVFTDQEILLEQSHGCINIAENIYNTPDAVFEWGSVTKLFLSVSSMQLVERGLLDLNENIKTYLPDEFLTKLKYDDPITMTHLLSHTAGFQEAVIELFVSKDRRIRTLEESLRLLQPAQVFRPGEVTAYSNFGSALAGYIIERISGLPYYAYVHEHIFAPLGMSATALLPDLSDNLWVKSQREHTNCYSLDLQDLGTLDLAIPWYPAGMATGTISDLRKFGQALLPDASSTSPLFLFAHTLGEMYTPTSFYPNGETGRNFHGFWAELHLAGTVIGHGGNTIGMSAMLLIDIENSFGTVIMTNQAGEQIYNRQMSAMILGMSDFSDIDNSENDVPVNTAFRSARTFQRGMLRLYVLMGNTMPTFQQNNDIISIPIFGELHRVASGVYISSEDSMISNYVFFLASNEAGRAERISMMFSDYIRVSWGLVIFEIIITLLLIVTGIYGTIVLIRLLVNKIRKKEQSFVGIRTGISAALLLLIINSVIIAIGAMSMILSMPITTILGIINILLSLAAIVCTIMLLLKMKTPDLSKRQKRQIITPAIMCAIMVVNVIYWQFWIFWV
ncbi:MAG: beta-lactamase family protein [Oscillospiraceae bacterium]|jgi:CubicO group peptidase (beta-lactamase class C family)|nr:beta-lactamase family protein [Oscillospiraceae bacterium]